MGVNLSTCCETQNGTSLALIALLAGGKKGRILDVTQQHSIFSYTFFYTVKLTIAIEVVAIHCRRALFMLFLGENNNNISWQVSAVTNYNIECPLYVYIF